MNENKQDKPNSISPRLDHTESGASSPSPSSIARLMFADKKIQNHCQKSRLRDRPRPFIHGRNTCDNCLIGPIIGQRYCALNLPDYDLCAKCYKKFKKGNIIVFEAVEDGTRPNKKLSQ